MARRRPTAFDISFPEEAASASTSKDLQARNVASGSTSRSSPSSTGGGSSNLKRKSNVHGPGEGRAAKTLQLPAVAYYESRDDELFESADLIIAGEDLDDVGSASEGADQVQEKPVRVLTEFSIFDPKHRNEMVSLAAIEQEDFLDRQFEGAGLVAPYLINEEDEGQEDGLDAELQYVRLGAILRYTLDYAEENEPVYIETEFAWYILKMPSPRYLPYFQHFSFPRKIAQLVVSSAKDRPLQRFDAFLAKFTSMTDMFGKTYEEQHLWDSMPEIQDAVDDYKDPRWLRVTVLVQYLMRNAPSIGPRARPRRRHNAPQRRAHPPPLKSLLGNPDLQVLKLENQNPTHVTPLIASLAQGLVQEDLVVVGPPPPPQNKALLETQKNAAHMRLCKLVEKAKQKNKYLGEKVQLARKSRFLRSVEIAHEKYTVGDIIVVPIGQNGDTPPPHLPDDTEDISPSSTIADYFWFAKIIYLDDTSSRPVHVQWLEHGSQILMEELAHPQELFFNDLCGSIPYKTVVGKITVHEDPKTTVKAEDFFVKLTHDKTLSSFVSINRERRKLVIDGAPDDNCPICWRIADQENAKHWNALKDDQSIEIGIAYLEQKYHFDDFILYRSKLKGPANIGHITGFKFPKNEARNSSVIVTVKRVGRMTDLAKIAPPYMLMHERDVYLTDEETMVDLFDLIRVCFVFPKESLIDLKEWLDMSPDHFYISSKFPKLEVKSWEDRRPLSYDNLPVCAPCVQEKLIELDSFREFTAHVKEHPLPVLDLFGGVGAFSHGLAQGSDCLTLANTVEISPSAAKTTKRNSPTTNVYNQCANVMLRYSIKAEEGHNPPVPKQLYDDKTPVPGPITRRQCRCVVIGFPCQSHSALNMFKTADDIKSNLILNALSWVDYLKPDICYFENVPGFLNFTFDATQAGRHRVEGGIPMGGLKLLIRALIDMRYQVRFALLQAGHYGTPQGRVRFFAIAAADGYPLPDMPQPTHDFPEARSLQIKLPVGGPPIKPIRTDNGIAPHAFVTIDDAISDLPRFDWKLPRGSVATQPEIQERAREVPALECKTTSAYCGYQGKVQYHHPARTTYQLAARSKDTQDLQHFTRCLLPKKVERVVSIPLAANADYRSLRPDQHEWQFSNPLSAVARKNYRPGLYGRLDKHGYFPTTVTNMDPTAKQSKVLNPYCKRMVTVRELARSQGFPDHFVFESLRNNVVTMHRQIGNAVPFPVGAALGRELRLALYRKWLKDRHNQPDAIQVDDD